MKHKTYMIKTLRALAAALLAATLLMPVWPAAVPDARADTDYLSELGNSMARISERVVPAVVNIATSKIVKTPRLPFSNPSQQKVFSLGSGVIVSSDGYIVTCNHVIAGAEDILVKLNDNREFKGKIVGMDSKTDIAVIKITADNLPTATWGDSAKLKTGEIVLAFGNPYGLNQTVTMGIVSATGRSGMGIVDYEDFIQTDASINPGNSGGALVNSRGELIGINDSIFSTSGGNQGIGFAVPSSMVKNIMQSIITSGKVVRGYIGVQVQPLNADLVKQFGLKDSKGVLLSDVTEGAPAEKAGLKRGDIITSIDGKKVDDAFHLRNQVASTKPGATVDLGFIRDGKPRTARVTVNELASDAPPPLAEESESVMKGVAVQELTDAIARQLNLKKDVKGVLVSGVSEESRALGFIQRGDVIMEINRTAVRGVAEYRRAVSKLPKNENVVLLVMRGASAQYVTISAQ